MLWTLACSSWRELGGSTCRLYDVVCAAADNPPDPIPFEHCEARALITPNFERPSMETPLSTALRTLAKELSCPVWCVTPCDRPPPSRQALQLTFVLGARLVRGGGAA
jgi:hypothetical protein